MNEVEFIASGNDKNVDWLSEWKHDEATGSSITMVPNCKLELGPLKVEQYMYSPVADGENFEIPWNTHWDWRLLHKAVNYLFERKKKHQDFYTMSVKS